ncbi:DDE-type integrase/transposase/recombinase [Micromonospora purpureochromogenes]|uniref:DDE-type integrase/transposase/recombinase n=1 Tax=Micromonospora purpureochromogenes TaxID=47872 RepID=UPI0034081AD6
MSRAGRSRTNDRADHGRLGTGRPGEASSPGADSAGQAPGSAGPGQAGVHRAGAGCPLVWGHDGKLYLATVIDLYSRRILGYVMGERHDAGLVVAALGMAAVTRGGHVAAVIFHSDRGSEYASADFARVCARWRVRQSMGRVGSCFDNAVAEATFSTIKVEYVRRRQFRTRAEARIKIATWITDFYDRRRCHSVCDGSHRSTTNDQRPGR